jgi:hypothetical protein
MKCIHLAAISTDLLAAARVPRTVSGRVIFSFSLDAPVSEGADPATVNFHSLLTTPVAR